MIELYAAVFVLMYSAALAGSSRWATFKYLQIPSLVMNRCDQFL